MEIQMTTSKPEVVMSLDGKLKVTFEVDKAKLFSIQDLPDKQLELTIKEYRERRSLDANAYAWVLITKIADKLLASKEAIYLKMLKEYGQSEMVSVRADIDVSGYFKYCEIAGQGKVNNKDFIHYKVYKGSSEYDSREMSIFIEGCVSEAKELGIDTRTPEEIESMKSLWGMQ